MCKHSWIDYFSTDTPRKPSGYGFYKHNNQVLDIKKKIIYKKIEQKKRYIYIQVSTNI